MRYSEQRFRRALALVRMLVGTIFICSGYEKLFDAMFFENGFMQRMAFWQTAVAPWYAWVWQILMEHTHRWAAFFGTVELFIGVALLLGLVTRPACLVAMLYIVHRFALSWYPVDMEFALWKFLEIHVEQFALLSLFWLLAIGHAGDVWGMGAIYHRFRVRLLPAQLRQRQPSYFEEEQASADHAADNAVEKVEQRSA